MNDGSGMTSPRLLGEWTHDPGCSCSRTSLGCCLQTAGTLWPESLRDWPRSGMWDGTGFYELPMSERATDAPDGSALLYTPNTRDGTPPRSRDEWQKHQLSGKG